ncbi:STAS domain-containing protein [Streptomyces sp. ALI-76-A]|uniref:STAS domain-containing protein n=1 Tax=Streptomyces sp. ALI-76-A TaxID=3025736 RepID=UPI00256EC4FA|nr:STAS domain-containing protein [Streptomyces sp. ALI-76-A]MDL5199209.1 STAS domain-containing protein [Streptomyces sp. ALI-76-A]
MTDSQKPATPGQLSIDHTAVDDVQVVTLRGEIDHTVTKELSEVLLSHDGATPPRTVVDLSGVTFMDSSGINVLITVHRTARDAQGWLRLAGTQEPVLRVLQLVGLDGVIPRHPTVEQAMSA